MAHSVESIFPNIWQPPDLDSQKNVLYLNRRGPLLKLGITGSLWARYIKNQRTLGWQHVDFVGPLPKGIAVQMEEKGLARLRGLGFRDGRSVVGEEFAGHSECWPAAEFEANSVSDLFPVTEERLLSYGIAGQETVSVGASPKGSKAQIYLFENKSGSDAEIEQKMLRLKQEMDCTIVARHRRWLIVESRD